MAFKIRKIFKVKQIQNFFSWIVYLYLKFVFKTSKFKTIGGHHYHTFSDEKKPGIVTFFHGRLALMPFAWTPKSPFFMLLSDHSDGHFISKVIQHCQIKSIYGSTNRGGDQALWSLIKRLKKGMIVGITPDGPRGPYQSISDGLITLARLSGAAILPSTYAIKRHKKLKTWDHFLFPLPFSNGVFMIADPIVIPMDASKEELNLYKEQLQNTMIHLQKEADTLCNL